jgi:inorganic pyrophosphatase
MLDGGELDWKLLTINRNDPLYSRLNDVTDIQRLLPGYISGLSLSLL